MVIRAKKPDSKLIIDLTGPQGNAFFLLSTARSYSRQLGLDSGQVEREMISGDYEHLVKTFDKYFGDLVILER